MSRRKLRHCFSFEDIIESKVNLEAVIRSIKSIFEQYVKLNKRIPPELLMSISSITDPSRLADIIVAHLSMKIPEKQEILEAVNVEKKAPPPFWRKCRVKLRSLM